MITIGGGFQLFGTTDPNFSRDKVANLAALKAAGLADYDRGHIVFCEATGKHYVFNADGLNTNDSTTGYFKELKTGGLEMVDVGSSALPTPSAETMQKLYLKNSSNPKTQNVKEEWVTVKGTIPANNVRYNGTNYPITNKGYAIDIVNSYHYLPPTSGLSAGTIILAGTTSAPSTTGSTEDWSVFAVVESEGDKNWYPDTVKVGDKYTLANNTVLVRTGDGWSTDMNGWTIESELPTEYYYWEKVGSDPIDVEPTSSVTPMWQPLVEIFGDKNCTTKPSGNITSVYVRFNRAISESMSWGSDNLVINFETQNPDVHWKMNGSYSFGYVIPNPIPANTVVEIGGSPETVDVSMPTEFYEGGLML